MLHLPGSSSSTSWGSTPWSWVLTGTTVLAGLVAGGAWLYTHQIRTPAAAAPTSSPPHARSATEAAPTADSAERRPANRYETLTRDELYAIARERDIQGRSYMRKAELLEAVSASDRSADAHRS